jgi:hypothetical protein
MIDPYTVLSTYGLYTGDFVTRQIPNHPVFIQFGGIYEYGPNPDEFPPAYTDTSIALGARIIGVPSPEGPGGASSSLPLTTLFDWGQDSVIS